MEYNKDEAFRAKEIAEKKFMAYDFGGAKKFILKAQQLYPSLEGLPQLLAILDVHMAAESKVNGQMDWYAILQVDLVADEALIKKQYRKLALMLHPDKNKSVGAEGAFKLIGEAWGVLSDKLKRSVYDHKRNYGAFQPPQKIQKPTPAAPANANNGYFRYPAPPKATSSNPATTFWTACPFCKMQYEYPRLYVNHNLLCPNCQKPFMAFEVHAAPRNGANATAPKSYGGSFSHMGSGPFTGMPRAAPYPNVNPYFKNVFPKGSDPSGPAPNVARETREKAKNEPAKQKEENPKRNQAKNASDKPFGGGVSKGSEKTRKKRKQWASSDSDEDSEDYTEEDDEVIETAKTKENAKKKGPKTGSMENSSKKKGQKVDVEDTPSRKKGQKVDKNDSIDSPSSQKVKNVDKEDLSEKIVEPETINVPDSDFHDFDKDRTEEFFEADQIWAVYDDDDGMPRFYARILKVLSLKGFKVKMSWLEAVTNKEKAVIAWIDAGFYQGCGDFKSAKVISNDALNIFSHIVAWEKGPKGVIRILPRKGDVWALYRQWSSTWDELTPPEDRHKYEMVEIANDFIEENGVDVIPLVKVDGFKSVFQSKQEVRLVPKNELLKFSHQVPAKRLSGEEAPNLPTNCWELDPAATSGDPEDEGKTSG